LSGADEPSPNLAFDDSRRLTGPNRWYPGTAVVLTPLDPKIDVPAWERRVCEVTAALGWPDPRPRAHRHAQGLFLAFAAPEPALFTATEINEWACEQASHGRFEHVHALPPDPADHFADRAAQERSRPLQRLRDAAARHGVPCYADDDALTLGAGRTGLTFARAALPLPMDVPWPRLADIPKALVSGSNGKTTTVRLIAAMARSAGHTPGLCSTEGITVDRERVAAGDYSGPAGARAVLRDPRVTLAVLETARGGIARRGLAVTQAEVAVVTNVSADHFGEYGIDSVDDIAELKLALAHVVNAHGLLVLNADDVVLMAAARRLPHAATAPTALFAADHDAPALRALRERGGATCGVRAGRLVLTHGGAAHDLGAVNDLPLAWGGAAAHNVLNLAAAAVAAAVGLGLPVEAVRSTAQSFGRDPQDNAGRLERWQHRGATVLIDYAHNPDGLARLLAVARALLVSRRGRAGGHRRLLLLLGQAGNRDDAAIAALARTAAAARPDLVMLKELPAMLRGRAPGEVPALLRRELCAAGLDDAVVQGGEPEAQAALALLALAREGDVLVLPLHGEKGRTVVSRQLTPGSGDPPRPC
jgi:UDP-N-acetylmuramyl tripeptide synthase